MKVVVVQTESSITRPFGPSLIKEGFEVEEINRVDQALDRLKNGYSPDLLLLDSSLNQPDAVKLCRMCKTDPDLEVVPILLLETVKDGMDLVDAVRAGADDVLQHPVSPVNLVARIQSMVRFKLTLSRLDDSESVLYTLAQTLEAKDPYTMGHADRVSNYAVHLGKALGVNSHDLETLRKGGLLHDVGKIAIPDAILTKPGKYTPQEFDVMKRHPMLGCNICQKLRTVRDALPLIRHHHERLDGTGYPDKISGDEISPLTRAVTIVDIYDALRSKRSYKDPFTMDTSFQIMWEEVEKGWWDRDILATWEKTVRSKTDESTSAT